MRSFTLWFSTHVQRLGTNENDESDSHADERNEETPRKVDLLLDVGHAGVGNQGSQVDYPVKPEWRHVLQLYVFTKGIKVLTILFDV